VWQTLLDSATQELLNVTTLTNGTLYWSHPWWIAYTQDQNQEDDKDDDDNDDNDKEADSDDNVEDEYDMNDDDDGEEKEKEEEEDEDILRHFFVSLVLVVEHQ
jgi:hypothetical protein